MGIWLIKTKKAAVKNALAIFTHKECLINYPCAVITQNLCKKLDFWVSDTQNILHYEE